MYKLFKNIKPSVSLVTLLILATAVGFEKTACSSFDAVNSYGSSPVLNKQKTSNGYVLISPFSQKSEKGEKNKIYLTDSYGREVKSWEVESGVFYSVLKPNGNLVVSQQKDLAGGKTGIIQEQDWNNNIVWEYKNEEMNHDFKVLPNDNIALTLWKEMPTELAVKIKGGVAGTEPKTGILGDRLIEVDNNGKEVWSWAAYEHLDPILDPFPDYSARASWTMIFGFSYLPKDPIEGKEAYLLSLRVINKLIIVRKDDGQIIWKSPEGMVSGQHDPTILPNGNILVFNNNIGEIYNTPPAGSNILEINPKTNEVVWKLENGHKGLENNRFFSYLVGGAQRLSNGNTFVSDGQHGHWFEVTPDKELVWDLENPFLTSKTGIWPNNAMFKAKKYTDEDVKWPEKLSSSRPLRGEICEKLGR